MALNCENTVLEQQVRDKPNMKQTIHKRQRPGFFHIFGIVSLIVVLPGLFDIAKIAAQARARVPRCQASMLKPDALKGLPLHYAVRAHARHAIVAALLDKCCRLRSASQEGACYRRSRRDASSNEQLSITRFDCAVIA